MKIIIIQFGNAYECLASTSILRGVCRTYKDPEIHVVVADKDSKSIFQHNPRVQKVVVWQVGHTFGHFDLLINITPGTDAHSLYINADKLIGFKASPKSVVCQQILYGNKNTRQNIFQVYYDLLNIKWKGEGYDLGYYPKSKNTKNKTGISLVNIILRKYVLNKLKLSESKIWNIHFRQSITDKIDEINKCQNLITDHILSMHIGIALRKYVYFLQTVPNNMKIEFFGKGEIIKVPHNVLTWK